jgi:predicted dienelactone hydrolase
VLLSHGGGLTGGTPLILRELSADLARQGFIVVAPFHGKTGLQARTLQVRLALDAVQAQARFTSHLDPTRLGMLGFSLGTAVTLELAGAIPNVAHLISYCAAHPEDTMSCDHAPDGKNGPAPGETLPARVAPLTPPLLLKAIALLDPFGVLFQHDELAAVTMPVLLFRPDRSELPGAANAFALSTALPHPPRVQIVPGRHFIFADVCPSELRSAAPEACDDPPGVDRAIVHTDIEAQIARFFHANL